MSTTERDPFDTAGTPNLSFKDMPVGTVKRLIADGPAEMAQQSNYETGEPDFWPAEGGRPPQPKMAAVITGTDPDTGEAASIWAPKTKKPGSKFAAIAAAQKAAGHTITAGTEIALKLNGTEAATNPRMSDRKLFVAKVTPGAPPAPAGDPFGGSDDQPPF